MAHQVVLSYTIYDGHKNTGNRYCGTKIKKGGVRLCLNTNQLQFGKGETAERETGQMVRVFFEKERKLAPSRKPLLAFNARSLREIRNAGISSSP